MANPTSNFGWQMPTNTDLVKDLPADFEVFGQAVDTSLMDLKGGTTGQVLSKASNTDMDFTWVAQDDSNAIQNAIVDAKGDLISATAADTPARLAVGTNGQVLTADSTQSTGLAWTTLSSGGMTLIQQTSASAVSSLSISSIPGTYKHLMLIWSTIYHSNADSSFGLRFNNDSGAKYNWQRIGASDTTLNVNYTGGTSVSQSGYEPFGFYTNAGTNELEKMAKGILHIYNYADAGSTKFFIGSWNYWQSGGPQRNTPFIAGNFTGAAITSLDIFRSTGTGTFTTAVSNTIKLYGVS